MSAVKKAGRPKADTRLGKVPVGLRLPFWLVEWLRDQDKSQSCLIEEALISKHKLNVPRPAQSDDQGELPGL